MGSFVLNGNGSMAFEGALYMLMQQYNMGFTHELQEDRCNKYVKYVYKLIDEVEQVCFCSNLSGYLVFFVLGFKDIVSAPSICLGKERFDCGRWQERWRTGWRDGR